MTLGLIRGLVLYPDNGPESSSKRRGRRRAPGFPEFGGMAISHDIAPPGRESEGPERPGGQL